MGNGDIGSDKPNLGGPNSVPGGEVIEARPQLTEEELKVSSYHLKLEWLQDSYLRKMEFESNSYSIDTGKEWKGRGRTQKTNPALRFHSKISRISI